MLTKGIYKRLGVNLSHR